MNTIATLAFQETLSSDLNVIHGLFGLGALLGPLILAFGLQFFKSLELSYFTGAGLAAITILLMVLQLSISSAAQMGVRSWIVTAVSQSAGISLTQAAPVATAFFLGTTAGQLGGAQVLRRGWMSEASLLYAACSFSFR